LHFPVNQLVAYMSAASSSRRRRSGKILLLQD
jgi:hypothetical protein